MSVFYSLTCPVGSVPTALWIGNAEKNFYKRVPKKDKEVSEGVWAEPVGRTGEHGLVHVTPNLARCEALDKSPVLLLPCFFILKAGLTAPPVCPPRVHMRRSMGTCPVN